MQAENKIEQMDWIEKITGVITSLLTSQAPERVNNKQTRHICNISFFLFQEKVFLVL